MRIFSIRLEEELARKIEQMAKLKGISKSAFVREILKKAMKEGSSNPVKEACQAMKQGRKPDVKVDWNKICKILSETEPEFKTVEEALGYSRRRERFEEEKSSD